MAYTALTCEEQQQSLETLLARAMVVKADGSWAFQTVSLVDSFTLASGSVTDDYTASYTSGGRTAYLRNGETGDEGNPAWSVVWADGGSGFVWNITDGDTNVLYYSEDDVTDPRDCTTWIAVTGSNPLPVFT